MSDFSFGSDAVVVVGTTDISEFLSEADFEIERKSKEMTPLGGAPPRDLVGQPRSSGTWKGYVHGTPSGIFGPAMQPGVTVTEDVTYYPQGNDSGLEVWTGSVVFSKYKITTKGDDIATFDVDWKVQGSWTFGTV